MTGLIARSRLVRACFVGEVSGSMFGGWAYFVGKSPEACVGYDSLSTSNP